MLDPISLPSSETVTVPVMQFLRPDGTERAATTKLPAEFADVIAQLHNAGCRFEAEMLTTGEVSITIADMERDLDIEVVPNGPEVQAAMLKILQRKAWANGPISPRKNF